MLSKETSPDLTLPGTFWRDTPFQLSKAPTANTILPNQPLTKLSWTTPANTHLKSTPVYLLVKILCMMNSGTPTATLTSTPCTGFSMLTTSTDSVMSKDNVRLDLLLLDLPFTTTTKEDLRNLSGEPFPNRPATNSRKMKVLGAHLQSANWLIFRYGGTNGFLDLFTKDSQYAHQYKYTAAPDADARAVQAAYWANIWATEKGSQGSISSTLSKASKLGDFLR